MKRQFTRKDIVAWLGQATVAMGDAYVQQGRVERFQYVYPQLTATVRGASRQPYVARVWLDTPRSVCTCPLGGNCKHVAAALLEVLKPRLPQNKDAVSPDALAVSPGVLAWLNDLRHLSQAVEQKRGGKSVINTTRLFYCLDVRDGRARVQILKGIHPESARAWLLSDRAFITPPQFVEDDDLPVLRQLWAIQRNAHPFPRRHDDIELPTPRRGSLGRLMEKLVATQRFFAAGYSGNFLEDGGPRLAQIVWKLRDDGLQQPEIEATPDAEALPVSPPWYLDRVAGEIGPLKTTLPSALAERFLALPPLSRHEAILMAEALAEIAPEAPRPATNPGAQCRVIAGTPVGELRLETLTLIGMKKWRNYPRTFGNSAFDYATPVFRYGEARVAPGEIREYVTLPGGEIVRLQRDHTAEAGLLYALREIGFAPVPPNTLVSFSAMPDGEIHGLPSETAWSRFMQEGRENLAQAGWRVVFDTRFRHHYLEIESWQADVDETKDGWLSLDMGVIVEGERLSLAPLLANLFREEPRWLDALSLASISPDESVTLETGDGRRLRVPAERLKPIARLLIDLFDGYREGSLRLSRWDAARLSELQDRSRWQFNGPETVIALAERLKASQNVQNVTPPQGLRLALRDYQRTGLSWLQYLRAQNLAGILADDMGLGKTAQALAHLLLEKEAGRLDKPALVVLPTSLIFNWENEARDFVPSLKVLSLHGKARKECFADIPHCDIALTTYPLLWRDSEALRQHEYHLLILDEAQTVKNFRSKSASVVRQLKARHRLCLTGTPLENHLGELWTQFDFLLPGFLGDSKSFTRVWRNPIEKQGDMLRRDLLARRLRPFILRRKKDEVATELPPKTVIVRTVELSGTQRDLYETVRAAMDEKVRSEIASKGFRRSQIIILDALLKLRQVCCDPRLVKSSVARKVKERAKLELFMDMLPELVAEGRHILVFSQFTAMLDLIEVELLAAGIRHARLTGETQDRETPIRAFQAGEAPVFLVSLRAGGVGLNLTAADTVIHYDPWWNPAMENQAADRAHRLGQDKPVFVYKLIVAGSIEEKILALQERKAELAAGILSEEHQGDIKFSEADIAALFEPLPGSSGGR
ncbi:MAG: DEAD/DEAH box helicase [Zoogloeaceae bacterium]|jgi:superfamily II DNA or RNA helicase|nr:DEAD/DEAH box helicase [Zoogloeaceae bacterium]